MNTTPIRISAAALFAGGVLALAGTGTALGQAPKAGADRFPISVEAMEAKVDAMFSQIDTNADGVINPEEFAAHPPRQGRPGDHGRPHGSAGEFGPGMHRGDPARRVQRDAELFKTLDQDGNGALSEPEFAARHGVQRELMQKRAFSRLDGNSDGVLDRSEFPPRRLAGLDTNGDGEISREEMRSRSSDKRPDAG